MTCECGEEQAFLQTDASMRMQCTASSWLNRHEARRGDACGIMEYARELAFDALYYTDIDSPNEEKSWARVSHAVAGELSSLGVPLSDIDNPERAFMHTILASQAIGYAFAVERLRGARAKAAEAMALRRAAKPKLPTKSAKSAKSAKSSATVDADRAAKAASAWKFAKASRLGRQAKGAR